MAEKQLSYGRDETIPHEKRLSELRPGESGTVARLELDGAQRRRLMDLGLVPGTRITVAFASPLEDPKAYQVRKALIALRDEQARRVVVTSGAAGSPNPEEHDKR